MVFKGELLYQHVFRTGQPVRDLQLANSKSLDIFVVESIESYDERGFIRTRLEMMSKVQPAELMLCFITGIYVAVPTNKLMPVASRSSCRLFVETQMEDDDV